MYPNSTTYPYHPSSQARYRFGPALAPARKRLERAAAYLDEVHAACPTDAIGRLDECAHLLTGEPRQRFDDWYVQYELARDMYRRAEAALTAVHKSPPPANIAQVDLPCRDCPEPIPAGSRMRVYKRSRRQELLDDYPPRATYSPRGGYRELCRVIGFMGLNPDSHQRHIVCRPWRQWSNPCPESTAGGRPLPSDNR